MTPPERGAASVIESGSIFKAQPAGRAGCGDVVRVLKRSGAPNRSRTCDLALRRRLLYPAELPGLISR